MGESKNSENASSLSGTGDRLRAVADRLHDGNKSELARSLGMKPSSFSKYLDGKRRPGAVVLEKLSQMGVNVHWILTGNGAMLAGTERIASLDTLGSDGAPKGDDSVSTTQSDDSTPHFHEVPLVRIRQDIDESLRLVETGRSEWVNDSFIREEYGVLPELLRDFKVSGDSMVDTIRPGDRVRAVLWDCRAPNDGTICILRGPVSLMVRRIRLQNRSVLLVADNPEVPNETISLEEWEEEYEPIARILEVRRSV